MPKGQSDEVKIVTLSDIFDQSVVTKSEQYEKCTTDTNAHVTKFISYKREHGASSKYGWDKPSGKRDKGAIACKQYIEWGLNHCHFFDVAVEDEHDPIIVYRYIPEEKRLHLIAVTDHTDMFEGKNEFKSTIERHRHVGVRYPF